MKILIKILAVISQICLFIFPYIVYDSPSFLLFGERPIPQNKESDNVI